MGNYWDDYSGSDANSAGIGDTAYCIDSDNDSYPLIEPWENYPVLTADNYVTLKTFRIKCSFLNYIPNATKIADIYHRNRKTSYENISNVILRLLTSLGLLTLITWYWRQTLLQSGIFPMFIQNWIIGLMKHFKGLLWNYSRRACEYRSSS